MGALIGLAVLLFIIWLVAVIFLKIVGFAIHVLLIAAVILAGIWLFKRVV